MTRQEEILTLFQSDARQALALMIEEYSPLLWTVAAERLTDPEDIRECVNDTFAGFWQTRTKFDPDKGTIANYLAAIARRRAVSMYRKNQRRAAHELHASADNMAELSGVRPAADTASRSADAFETAENHLLLEETLAALKPEDADIIRMKYYGGMTVQEIADSLSLPYETVKKRHQRSLSKMRRILLAVLIVALIALLTACAYMVLRHFRLIPGYGVTDETDVSIYQLKAPVVSEGEYGRYEIDKALLIDGTVYLHLTFDFYDEESRNIYHSYTSSFQTSYLLYDTEDHLIGAGYEHPSITGDIVPSSGGYSVTLARTYTNLVYDGTGLNPDGEELTLRISSFDINFSFSLSPTEEETTEDYSYALTEEGGLLAVPRIEDGELITAIYPLSTGDKKILQYLVYDAYMQNKLDAITLTSKTGDVLTADVCPPSGSSRLSMSEWNFGAAEPGNYTLHIPYLYFETTLPETITIPLDLEQCTWDESVYELPYGSFSVIGLERRYPEPGTFFYGHEVISSAEYWILSIHLEPKDDWMYSDVSLFSMECPRTSTETGTRLIFSNMSTIDSETQDLKNRQYLLEFTKDDYELSQCQLILETGKAVSLRWMHEIEIPVAVYAEE